MSMHYTTVLNTSTVHIRTRLVHEHKEQHDEKDRAAVITMCALSAKETILGTLNDPKTDTNLHKTHPPQSHTTGIHPHPTKHPRSLVKTVKEQTHAVTAYTV